ncbi:MAG: nickel-responsive transcriptional regulator NikR [Lentisphaerales bacterium]|jgi:CopG family nickel-responsive transcriptional regulator|nr:MAG: nickel-responsive transcriptional regulator NikR [Lentisphaerales bacterium]
MKKLTRFSVSLDEGLLERFDRQIEREGYPTRSKAIADLMGTALVQREWKAGGEVAAGIVMVYDHHKRDLVNKLTSIQHDYHHLIISSQHIHLDHDHCLEMVVVRGDSRQVETLARRLKSTKGVKHSAIAAATTGGAL